MYILLDNTIDSIHYNQLYSLMKNHDISESKMAEKKTFTKKALITFWWSTYQKKQKYVSSLMA